MEEIEEAIWNAEYLSGHTGTADGIEMVNRLFSTSMGDRPSKQNVLVWITDGNSNIRANNTQRAAQAAQEAGIYIMAIG